MGYYSEVALTLYKRDYIRMVQSARITNDPNVLRFVTAAPDLHTTANGDTVTLYWAYVKWRSDYTNVGFVTDFIKNTDVPFSFLRVGEEAGDVEQESRDDDWADLSAAASVVTTIEVDGIVKSAHSILQGE